MHKTITITLLANNTPPGLELAELLETALAASPFEDVTCVLHTVLNSTYTELMIAGLRDDLVVFDASVEDDLGLNYQALNMWPSTMAHFLTVSRTHIPINFQPFYTGGIPGFSRATSEKELYTLSNDAILHWLLEKIQKMLPKLPRPEEERMEIGPNEFFSRREELLPLVEKIIHSSTASRAEEQRKSGLAFISYLSKYSNFNKNKPSGVPAVEDLANHIRHRDPKADYPVYYYIPGALSGEFMTEYRRWQVLSIIDRRIRISDEVWVYESEDYYDSWWTLAELAVLAYMRYDDNPSLPKVFAARPVGQGFEVGEADFLVQNVDETLAREFGRRLSNTDPLTGGPETMKMQRKIASMYRPVQWLVFKGSKWLGELMMAGSPMYKDMKKYAEEHPETLAFSTYRARLKSRVYSEAFFEERIVTCPGCTRQNIARHKFDFNKFMEHQMPGQYRLTTAEMESVLENGKWTCGECGFTYNVLEMPHPQYMWWPVRAGRPTGPGGVYVESRKMYTLERAGAES